MFIIPCKYIKSSTVFQCVQSILKYHPSEKILIVDSYSDDLEYQKNILTNDNIIYKYQKDNHC